MMELTQDNLASVAAKLSSGADGLTDAERALLNEVFNIALNAVEPEVEGYSMGLGIALRAAGPAFQRPGGTGGGTGPTLPTPSTDGVTGKPGGGGTSSFDPVSVKFF